MNLLKNMQDSKMYQKFPPPPATMGGVETEEKREGLVILYKVLRWFNVIGAIIFVLALIYLSLIVIHEDIEDKSSQKAKKYVPILMTLIIQFSVALCMLYVYWNHLRVPILIFAWIGVVAFVVEILSAKYTHAVGSLVEVTIDFTMADLIRRGYHKV